MTPPFNELKAALERASPAPWRANETGHEQFQYDQRLSALLRNHAPILISLAESAEKWREVAERLATTIDEAARDLRLYNPLVALKNLETCTSVAAYDALVKEEQRRTDGPQQSRPVTG